MLARVSALLAVGFLSVGLVACGLEGLIPGPVPPPPPDQMVEEFVIIPGVSIGKRTLDWTLEQFIQDFGVPDEVVDRVVYTLVERNPVTVKSHNWDSRGRGVLTLPDAQNQVIGIELLWRPNTAKENRYYTTEEGLGVGRLMSTVREVLGDPNHSWTSLYGLKYFDYDLGMAFAFEDHYSPDPIVYLMRVWSVERWPR